MSPSLIIFGIAFLGLVTLFACKAFEEWIGAKTPLSELRRVGDPLVRAGIAQYAIVVKTTGKGIRDNAAFWGRTVFLRIEAFSLSRTHLLAARLHDYLMHRKVKLDGNGRVSAHLKNVVESTGETQTRSNTETNTHE